MATGRPTIFTEELGNQICDRLSEGESLNAICRDPKMPAKSTVMAWARDLTHPFSNQYAVSRDVQIDLFVDEVMDIVRSVPEESEAIQKARLTVDSIKWIACKLAPKKYGERIVQEHTGPNGASLLPQFPTNAELRMIETKDLSQKLIEAEKPKGNE